MPSTQDISGGTMVLVGHDSSHPVRGRGTFRPSAQDARNRANGTSASAARCPPSSGGRRELGGQVRKSGQPGHIGSARQASSAEPDRMQAGVPGAGCVHVFAITDEQAPIRSQSELLCGGTENPRVRLGEPNLAGNHHGVEAHRQPERRNLCALLWTVPVRDHAQLEMSELAERLTDILEWFPAGPARWRRRSRTPTPSSATSCLP